MKNPVGDCDRVKRPASLLRVRSGSPQRDIPINTLCTVTVAVPAWATGRAITWDCPNWDCPDGRSPLQLGGPFGFRTRVRLTPRSAGLSDRRCEAYSSSSASLAIELPCLYHNWDRPIKRQFDQILLPKRYTLFLPSVTCLGEVAQRGQAKHWRASLRTNCTFKKKMR